MLALLLLYLALQGFGVAYVGFALARHRTPTPDELERADMRSSSWPSEDESQ